MSPIQHIRGSRFRRAAACVLAIVAALGATEARARATLPIGKEPAGTLTVGVWMASGAAADEIEKALLAAELPAQATGQALLASGDRHVFVEVTVWPSPEAARAYAVPYVPSVEAYWRRSFEVHRVFGRAPLELRADSSVQWSEFLLRDATRQQDLGHIVSGMVAAMAGGGAETLAAIGQLHSTQGTSIGLLGLWTTEEGFEVFERNETFGSQPYWEPYADNAHWMLGVLRIR